MTTRVRSFIISDESFVLKDFKTLYNDLALAQDLDYDSL